jgi:outer membrane protein assembly factor BamB
MKRNITVRNRLPCIGPFFLSVLFSIWGVVVIANAGDQPQWGEAHSRNMVSAETGLPDTFDPKSGANVRWSVPLGTSTYSTPVIAGGKVLIGTNNDEPRDPRHEGDRGVLLCLDEKDGRFCWQLVVPKLVGARVDAGEIGIVSPATVEGDRVYIVSNRNEVMCLALNGMANGNQGPYLDEGRHMSPDPARPMPVGTTDADILWIFDINAALGVHQHDAAHGSVLVHGRYLYVCTSNGVDNSHMVIPSPNAPGLIVLDKTTGRLVAQDAERMAPRTIHCTWSSPTLGEVRGRPLIFFGGGDGVCYAFNIPAPTATAAQPVAAPETARGAGVTPVQAVATAAPQDHGTALGQTLKRVWRFDCDPAAPKEDIFRWQENRKEGPSNITGMPVFYQGKIYVTVGGDYWHGKHQSWLECIDAGGTGDITRSGEVWSHVLQRHCLSTPSICDGLVYIVDCGPSVHCLDVKTGREYWSQPIKGDVWGSTLVADGKVYVGTQKRMFYVFAAGKEKRLISSIELDSAMNSSPVAANGVLYVATMQRLYAIAKR